MFFRRTPRIRGQESIAALEMVEINGMKQALLMRGENRGNPILLFLHGGPGTAQISCARRYQKALERDYVVVNWDQRGAGLSYSSTIPKEYMTISQMIEDTRTVSELLLERFGQEKLFLVGHSWGTILGTLTAARHPDLFHAYVGAGQLGSVADGEAVSYRFTLDTAKQRGLTKAVKDLERIGPPPYPGKVKDTYAQRKWLSRFGGNIRSGTIGRLGLALLLSTEYTLLDLIRFSRGMRFSVRTLFDEWLAVNLSVQAPRLEVPVYFVLGRSDMTCPVQVAEDYFNRLSAPFKELVWMESAAHLMWAEEPDEFAQVMRKILQDHRARQLNFAETA